MNYQEYIEKEERRIQYNISLMEQGVEFMDIRSAYIEEGCKIGAGTKIYPNVIVEGESLIGENCVIGPGTRIVRSTIGDRTKVDNSVILESRIGEDTKVGPFAYLRPNSTIGNNCKVGDFVEVKNSSLGDGTKAAHLSYIGDSDVGKEVNIGCGVVFVNYDGSKKYRSTVSDRSFIGCNVNLVSPVVLGEGSYVAAGSTVTTDVPADALCVARAKGRIIEGWVSRRGLLNKK
jgi:bifunctional UDP-N-acetylglucosamine pyrophosphorylase/glucosamine-1-phosphate N-acetyltransferase